MAHKRTAPAERRFALSGIVHLIVGCVLLAICVAVFLPTLGTAGVDPLVGSIMGLAAGGLGWAYIRCHGRVREIRLTEAGIELQPAGTVIRWEHVSAVALPGLGMGGQQRSIAPRALRFTLTDRSFRWEPGRWLQFAGTGRIHLVGGDSRAIVAAILERLAARS